MQAGMNNTHLRPGSMQQGTSTTEISEQPLYMHLW